MASWQVIGAAALLWILPLVDLSGDCPKRCRCLESNTLGLQVDCSGLGLEDVPEGLSPYTTSLDLSRNAIFSLEPSRMEKLAILSRLNLSKNGMKYVDVNAFQGLISLKELFWQSNTLDISDVSNKLLPATFQPLSRLEKLDIHNNIPMTLGYPNKMWVYLENLVELDMDGAECTFGDGFLSLRNLRSLSLRGSNVRSITSETFRGLNQSSLDTLNLEDCSIGVFEGQAFQYITTLKRLVLSNNPLGKKVANMASGSTFIPGLELLDLNQTELGSSINALITSPLCGSELKRLTVSNNMITSLNSSISKCFPELQLFSLTFNSFYGSARTIGELLLFPKLQLLNLSSQAAHQGILVEHNASLMTHEPGVPSIAIPPTLKYLDISNNGFYLQRISSVNIVSNVNMVLLRASNTSITDIEGRVKCYFTPAVREIDLTDNNIRTFGQDWFADCDWSLLFVLKVGGNSLSGVLDSQKNRPFFKPLSGLQELDLSRNNIIHLDPDTFSNNTGLRILDLSGNVIYNFTARVAQLRDLQLLGLSGNRISGLTTRTTHELQLLIQSSPTLRVDLLHNPLKCTCEYLPAIRWIADHKKHFKQLRKYNCTFKDHSTGSFAHLRRILEILEGQCQSFLRMKAAIFSSLVAMVIIVVVAVIFRWRFTLEVSWYKPRSTEDEVEYEFDSFVVYNNQDKNWVEKELCRNLEINNRFHYENRAATRNTDSYKLCCHHRDFMIGMHIIDNVTEAFDRSRTTLIVMSNVALCGNWWQMELQMAVQTAVARRTNSLLFVFLEPLEGRLVTPQLRRILHTYTCKRWYPCDLEKQRDLWKDLKIAMKFPRRNGLAMDRRS